MKADADATELQGDGEALGGKASEEEGGTATAAPPRNTAASCRTTKGKKLLRLSRERTTTRPTLISCADLVIQIENNMIENIRYKTIISNVTLSGPTDRLASHEEALW